MRYLGESSSVTLSFLLHTVQHLHSAQEPESYQILPHGVQMHCFREGKSCEEPFPQTSEKHQKGNYSIQWLNTVYRAYPVNGHDSLYSAAKGSPDCWAHRTSLGCIQLIFEGDFVKLPWLYWMSRATPSIHPAPAILTLSKRTWTVCTVARFSAQTCLS